MITAAHMQATVVDITNPSASIPPQLVIDANVLYWIFYPNFTSLASVGGRSPVPYQTRHYPKFWRNASKLGTKFLAELTNMGEFVKLAEHAEWEAIWCTDAPSSRPNLVTPVMQFDPRICKLCRYHYAGQLAMVRQAVETMVASARKAVGLLPQFASADDQQTAILQEWRSACGDLPDSVLIATAKQHGVTHVLSDDSDLATFAGITVYTANNKTISAASAAGKLK